MGLRWRERDDDRIHANRAFFQTDLSNLDEAQIAELAGSPAD